jgi:hypothetical protein
MLSLALAACSSQSGVTMDADAGAVLDPCATLSCSMPPARQCVTNDVLRTFMPGTCSNGACQYASTDAPCSMGCKDGACVGDACMGIVCQTPPGAECLNPSTARSYATHGACAQGACSYAPSDVACQTGEKCLTGTCRWDDASLSLLAVMPGQLSFSPTKTSYAVTVAPGTTQVVITPTAAQPNRSQVWVNGTLVAPGGHATVATASFPAPITVRVAAESGNSKSYTVVFSLAGTQQAYLKASNTEADDSFGRQMAISADGNTLAIGTNWESSSATGVNADQTNNGKQWSGAVYVFTRVGGVWSQQAYVKASNTDVEDGFGLAVSLSGDGNLLAVGAPREDSSAQGLNGDQTNNSAAGAGAVYLFSRTAGIWAQTQYVKASNARAGQGFGSSVAISSDGQNFAVGALGESSNATGANGNQADTSLPGAGAAYVFVKNGSTWSQQAYLKASNPYGSDHFGTGVALSSNGDRLAVAASDENCKSKGVNGNQNDKAQFFESGAVYVFTRTAAVWAQEAYLKASNTDSGDRFGTALALSGDGNTLVAGASAEDSNATGINGNAADNSNLSQGAAYIFARSGAGAWSQQAYVKPSNGAGSFGTSAATTFDGDTVAIGATFDNSGATGINGNQADMSKGASGAVFVFVRAGTVWSQTTYVKASNTDYGDNFGDQVALSSSGDTLAVTAADESSSSTGVGGDQQNNGALHSGSAYVFVR